MLEYGTNAKMNPPLRRESDRIKIIEGLKDGTIDIIASDHAPHTKDEKQGIHQGTQRNHRFGNRLILRYYLFGKNNHLTIMELLKK